MGTGATELIGFGVPPGYAVHCKEVQCAQGLGTKTDQGILKKHM